jgi:ABC-type multidrug transport system fused ATPase/permease subunit
VTELKKVHRYLGDLEGRIRFALTSYVLVLFLGSFIIGVGFDKLSRFSESTRPELLFLISVAALATILVLVYTLSRIGWIGELHISLDRRIFGFLKRTNTTIFGSLLSALKPEDRKKVAALAPERQGTLVQSVFSALSNDAELFQRFLKTKIFRNWTIYWISVYGTLTCSALTVVAFVFVALALDRYAGLLFVIAWLLAATHLSIVLGLGHRLVTISKSLVDSMVESHQQQIAKTVRENLTEEEEFEEADVMEE